MRQSKICSLACGVALLDPTAGVVIEVKAGLEAVRVDVQPRMDSCAGDMVGVVISPVDAVIEVFWGKLLYFGVFKFHKINVWRQSRPISIEAVLHAPGLVVDVFKRAPSASFCHVQTKHFSNSFIITRHPKMFGTLGIFFFVGLHIHNLGRIRAVAFLVPQVDMFTIIIEFAHQ